jgi:uncharacterized GH25 family protein
VKTRLALIAFVAVLAAAVPASAHFPWVAIEKDGNLHVWFSELAEPDNADLLDRITNINVWTRSEKAAKQPVTRLTKKTADGGGSLVASVPTGTTAASAYINYGVLERRGERFQLEYHAKYLDAKAADLKTLARDEALKVDIVPQKSDKAFTLTVLFQGKPAAGAEVVIFDSVAAETTAKADEDGRLEMPITRPGLYSIRAKWVVKEAGKLGDQEFPQTNHYSTLALRVP